VTMRPLLAAAVSIGVWLGAAAAGAQPTTNDPCARYVYASARRLLRRPLSERSQRAIVLDIVARADACGAAIPVEVRTAARRARALAPRSGDELLGAVVARDLAQCSVGAGGVPTGQCVPDSAAIGELRVSVRSAPRARGAYRAFLVGVIDRLARSAGLAGAAQVLWLAANHGESCSASFAVSWIWRDVADGNVRSDATPPLHRETERQGGPVPMCVALPRVLRRGG